MAAARKIQFETVMNQPLPAHSFADAGLIQRIDRSLFQHAGADAAFDIFAAVLFQNDRVDTLLMKEVPE